MSLTALKNKTSKEIKAKKKTNQKQKTKQKNETRIYWAAWNAKQEIITGQEPRMLYCWHPPHTHTHTHTPPPPPPQPKWGGRKRSLRQPIHQLSGQETVCVVYGMWVLLDVCVLFTQHKRQLPVLQSSTRFTDDTDTTRNTCSSFSEFSVPVRSSTLLLWV